MPSVRINGASYEYLWWGSGDTGPPLLLVHEAAGHARGWGAFPQQLADATGRRVYAYSRLGWGQSDALSQPIARGALEEEALDTLPALRAALRLEEVVLAGFRDGASLALLHAGAASMPTAAVIAIAPLLFVDDALRNSITADARRPFPESLRAMPSEPERTLTSWVSWWTSKEHAQWRLDDFVVGVTCPALGLRGADDAFCPPRHLERLGTLIKHLEPFQLPGCRHHPHLDNPRAVVTAVIGFLSA